MELELATIELTGRPFRRRARVNVLSRSPFGKQGLPETPLLLPIQLRSHALELLARQKVNYHLHALEGHGLVRLAQERKWGGLTERLLVATAASYVVSPSALGPVALGPNREGDRLSASYLIALGGRVVPEG